MIETIDGWLTGHYDKVLGFVVSIGLKLLMALLTIVIGLWIASKVHKAIKIMLEKSELDAGLVSFLSSFLYVTFRVLVFVTAASQLGIQMTSFVAILGAAGLAVGMAFSGTLSNFAGGIMILVLKPFKVGDVILTQSLQGTVREIQMFNTILMTADNKIVYLPNGPVANGSIVNFTKTESRRIEWLFELEFVDVEKVRSLASEFLASQHSLNPKIEKTKIIIQEIKDPKVILSVHTWAPVNEMNRVQTELNAYLFEHFFSKRVTLISE